MRHPLWLLNNILLLFLIGAFIALFVLRPRTPHAKSFMPSADIKPFQREVSKVDLNKIYTNDLFETYKSTMKIEEKVPEKESRPLPLPPRPIFSTKPSTPAPKFLEPLKIQIKGIITGNNEQSSVAIIEHTSDKRSKNYRIGDVLDDAQLIRILKNKIIFVRANGQQETLYVSPHDAELELLLSPTNWKNVIKKIDDSTYSIDPELFAERIRSLGQFIEHLNITTVYHKGKSIGCRIGKIDVNSIGFSLGLQPGDIIEQVQGISTATTQDRLSIYNTIQEMSINETIRLTLIRRGRSMELSYILQKTDIPQTARPLSLVQTRSKEEIEQEKINILKAQEKFAPSLDEMYKKERENIVNIMERKKRNILNESVKP